LEAYAAATTTTVKPDTSTPMSADGAADVNLPVEFEGPTEGGAA